MPIPSGSGGGGSIVVYPGDYGGYINGVLPIGPGTNYAINSLNGWKDFTAYPLGTSATLKSREVVNGSYAQPFFTPSRVVQLGLQVVSTASVSFAQAVENLRAQVQPNGYGSPTTLTLQVDGVTATASGVASSRGIPINVGYQVGYTTPTIEITCAEPRLFGAAVAAQTLLPTSNGGLTFNATPNFTFNPGATNGAVTLANNGDTAGPLVFNIYGPLTGAFTITNAATGQVLAFNSSVVIAAGDYLMIDMENRNVLYNGQLSAARNAWVQTRGWFNFTIGASTYQFNASTYSATATMVVTGTPAWL